MLTECAAAGKSGPGIAAAVALAIAAGYWFTASMSCANPAITFARALSNAFAGIRIDDVPLFVLGQLVGCLLASAFCARLFAGDASRAAPAQIAPSDQRGR